MKEIKQGDYFLLPYAGRKQDLLVRAERPLRKYGTQWFVSGRQRTESIVELASCQPVPPSTAKRLMSPNTQGNAPHDSA